ncbi:copper-transporting ATPase RAN1 [Olea europaea subsp. europaea]|uniref:Copper-transporting ATPase RAN1 n=1 Tax=Olea europaea subsp. europaea TaxID=158383 RepID=A0A8S0QH49_OLEEU|nr:copper-transporting ATPase RAN1 [Olea europaea subsp. europaea]
MGHHLKPVEGLVKIGGNPIMVTDDNWRTSQAIDEEVGSTYGRAEVIPTGKVDVILSFQISGKIVGKGEFNATLIQPGDVFKVTLDLKILIDEYAVRDPIKEDENRPPIDEEKFFEKEPRPVMKMPYMSLKMRTMRHMSS